ncbi:hypothetical protein KL935_001298 [Ogataea polymorpha]|nr:hypothetical protein KL935_001298 [Ogataea polymorpha]
MDVEQQLSRLNIRNYEDITSDFFAITSAIEYGSIVKSKQFKLLEGTHALEVLNPKLDTALLKPEILHPVVETLDQAAWVMVRLLGSVCAWLDNNSLSVSVLSCYFVEQLIQRKPVTGELVERCVAPFVKGVISFVSRVLKLGVAGVIYEEEDLNTQTMDLDFSVYDGEETVLELQKAVTWVRSQPESASQQLCVDLLLLIEHSLHICEITEICVELYENRPQPLSFANDALEILARLAQPETVAFAGTLPPVACFSANVQKTLNNRSPPKPLAHSSFPSSLENFTKLFTDFQFMLNVLSVRDSVELYEFLNIFMSRRQFTTDPDEILGNHVVVRALMQLFLIRDDRSILGSRRWNISTLLMDVFSKISLQNSKLQSSTDEELRGGLEKLVTQIEPAFYNFLTSISQNPSRQRQFVNKELIIWDSIQVEAENFELESHTKLQDTFANSELPVMPVSSFVYYLKLTKMAELLFKSIELCLFKDCRELHLGYWLLANQLDYLVQHLKRLVDINQLRQTQLTALSKRIKKAKGDKKARLREEYETKKQSLPQLLKMQLYLNMQLTKYQIHKSLAENRAAVLRMLGKQGLMDLPKLCKASEETLYNLQFKSFQSIGVPQLPSFRDYKEMMKQQKWLSSQLSAEANASYQKGVLKQKSDEINANISRLEALVAELQFPEFITERLIQETRLLKKANVATLLTFSQTLKVADLPRSHVAVVFEKYNHHLYYPNIKVAAK